MKIRTRAWLHLAAAALAASQVVAAGCSSASPDVPDAAPGQGGAGAGQGGGGAGGGGGAVSCGPFSGANAAVCPDLSNGDTCAGTEAPCWKTCGPLKSGVKNCVCGGGTWNCPLCEYDPDPAKSYSCYKRPATPMLCPPDATDPTGMMLPKSGDPCVHATCAACGSENSFAYRDSTGIPKMGYCVCSSADPAAPGKWSCASVKEWPPACLTDR
jgi:hypothetical protein